MKQLLKKNYDTYNLKQQLEGFSLWTLMNQVLAVKNMVFIYITAVDGNAISLAMSSQTTCQVILAYLCSEHSSMRVLSLNHF